MLGSDASCLTACRARREGYRRREIDAETLRLRPRMEQSVLRLARLGPRPTLELLIELGCTHGILPEIADRLACYARLSPELVRAVGADRIAPRRPVLVLSK